MSADLKTPCIGVCALDQVTGQCFGCGRTGSEIAGWIAMSVAERDAVMAALPARVRAMEAALTASPAPEPPKNV